MIPLLPAANPPAAGISCHLQNHFYNPLSTYQVDDLQPAGDLQAVSNYAELKETGSSVPSVPRSTSFISHNDLSVDQQKPNQHEKQARRETVMATCPGEMLGSFRFKKRWYEVGD